MFENILKSVSDIRNSQFVMGWMKAITKVSDALTTIYMSTSIYITSFWKPDVFVDFNPLYVWCSTAKEHKYTDDLKFKLKGSQLDLIEFLNSVSRLQEPNLEIFQVRSILQGVRLHKLVQDIAKYVVRFNNHQNIFYLDHGKIICRNDANDILVGIANTDYNSQRPPELIVAHKESNPPENGMSLDTPHKTAGVRYVKFGDLPIPTM